MGSGLAMEGFQGSRVRLDPPPPHTHAARPSTHPKPSDVQPLRVGKKETRLPRAMLGRRRLNTLHPHTLAAPRPSTLRPCCPPTQNPETLQP
jgi:hypothetical protein